MLHLVPDPSENQGPRAPRRRKRRGCTVSSLTPDENRFLRAALHNLRRSAGTWAALADMMDVAEVTLTHAACGVSRGSPGLALRAARVAGVHVEALLSGTITEAGKCPTCGTRVAV